MLSSRSALTPSRVLFLTAFVVAAVTAGLAGRSVLAQPQSRKLFRAPAISNVIDGVTFASGNWKPDLEAGAKGSSLGNHRAVVVVETPAAAADADPAVIVTIPWRRHDADPSAKAIVVVNAATGTVIENAIAARVDSESGDVIFRPEPGSATYDVYYMPWQTNGGSYPTVTYPTAVTTPDAVWARAVRERGANLPRAKTTRIESINDFHSFFPMEIVATKGERATFMAGASSGWRLVPEYRDYSIRMRHDIPQHWAARPAGATFESRVLRDEYFTFQVGVVAGASKLENVRVSFEGFPATWTKTLTCFNSGGIDEHGKAFTKTINVEAGDVQPLWIGVQVPKDQAAGVVTGQVVVAVGGATQRVPVRLTVDSAEAINHGFDEPELMSRLAWLNSTAGTDADFIVRPFTPIAVDGANGHTLSILGRSLALGASGLPATIQSLFTSSVTIGTQPSPVLASPIGLAIDIGGKVEQLQSQPFTVREESRGRAVWTAASQSPRVRMSVTGALEYDGMLDYAIEVRALQDLDVDDISLPIAFVPAAAEYMLGLGRTGGRRPASVDWKWKVENYQEGVWLGGINRGLQYVLRDVNYERPLNTNFYQSKPLNLPPSWYNGGKGGIRIDTTPTAVTATNYSGPRHLAAGETLHFNVRLLLTPFKPVDTKSQLSTRFVHRYVPVDEAKSLGGTVINVHHANEINPYINYPFYNTEQAAAYINEAHSKGVKVKLYDTIRELSYRAYEIFAMRSLGDEIFNDGKGGGHSWLQEHLDDHYYSAWHASATDDAAILDKGTSRWTNYYVEGLAWLADHQKIDGLYLDDVAFGRETMRRMMSVMSARRPELIIDLHSANQFNPRDGFNNSAMLYMELFPYISRLWFGEYFDYSKPDDYWMTEVSGLPFGLMGEMLQDGGHPYRGLLYGMTTRFWGTTDPRPVWKVIDAFGIADSTMFGYWRADTPVRTNNPAILATTFLKPGGAFIALASWSDRDETVALNMNLAAMGFAGAVHVYAPSADGLQTAREIDPRAVVIPAKQGLFVRVEPAKTP